MKEKFIEILLKWLPDAKQEDDVISWDKSYDGCEIKIAYILKEDRYRYGISAKCDNIDFGEIIEAPGYKIKKYPNGLSVSREMQYEFIISEDIVKYDADKMFMIIEIALKKEKDWKDFSELVEEEK